MRADEVVEESPWPHGGNSEARPTSSSPIGILSSSHHHHHHQQQQQQQQLRQPQSVPRYSPVSLSPGSGSPGSVLKLMLKKEECAAIPIPIPIPITAGGMQQQPSPSNNVTNGTKRPVREASLRCKARRFSFAESDEDEETAGGSFSSEDELELCGSPRKRFQKGNQNRNHHVVRDGRRNGATNGTSGPRWKGEDMLRFPGYASVRPATIREEDVTVEWVASGGFDKPYLLQGCNEQRLETYRRMNSVEYIRDQLGPHVEVRTIDVKTQNDGPKLSLDDWCQYWKYKTESQALGEASLLPPPRHAKRQLNVVSLSLANSPLEKELEAPGIVQHSDLVRLFWPKDTVETKPKAELYALMSPAKCYTDWHIDFGGSSVWYNVVRGKKYFALAPPTEHNLKSFAAWANSSRQEKVNLLVYLKDPVLYELEAGETMIIPGGWPHAVYTPSDSIAVGGNFLHPFNLNLQLEIWKLEDAIGVPMSCRFPAFTSLMWYVAKSISTLGNGPTSFPGEDMNNGLEAAAMSISPLERSGSTNHENASAAASFKGVGRESGVNGSHQSFSVLKLKVKTTMTHQDASDSKGLKIRLPNSPRKLEEYSKRQALGTLKMARTARAVKLLLAHSKCNPNSGFGKLLLVLKEWLHGGARTSAPHDIHSPREMLEELQILLGALKILDSSSENVRGADYGNCKLGKPQFNEEATFLRINGNFQPKANGHQKLHYANGFGGNGVSGANGANGVSRYYKDKVMPLVKEFNSSNISACVSTPTNGLGPNKKVKKNNGVRDRLKKKLGMR